jgi:hypothetical protein
MEKIAVIGSRNFPEPELVRQKVRKFPPDTILVSGGAGGVDSIAEDEARKCGLQVIIFRAEWDKYGKAAGHIRNEKIVDEVNRVYAFWDGESRGTKDTMTITRKQNKPLHVITRHRNQPDVSEQPVRRTGILKTTGE